MKKIVQIKTLHLFTPSFFKQEQINPQKIVKQTNDTDSMKFDFARKGSRLIKSSSIKNKNVLENDTKVSKATQKNIASRLQNPKRSVSRVKQHPENMQQKIVKSYSISRYDTRRQTQANESQQCFKTGSKWMMQAKEEYIRERMKTQLSCRDVKEEMMKRISNKINFMKRMTSQGNKDPQAIQSSSPDKSLFKFDKLSDFCLKNINKSLKIYQKDLSRAKDKKYYQLKIEGHILTNELQQIRNVIVKNKEKQIEPEVNLGVIGNCIDVKGQQKVLKSHRMNSSHFKKKAKNIHKKIQKNIKNPFRMDDMHGWEVGIQKIQDFYI